MSTRGKAACNGCRSRKQKCDEKRPTCGRCRSLNRACVWPKLQKRGPVKGYTETLENRLDEAENALYRILLVADERTIEAAFQNDTVNLGSHWQPPVSASGESSSRLEAKKADLVAHWESYPLTTARDVTRWAREMRSQPGNEEAEGSAASQPTAINHQDSDPSFGNVIGMQPLGPSQSFSAPIEGQASYHDPSLVYDRRSGTMQAPMLAGNQLGDPDLGEDHSSFTPTQPDTQFQDTGQQGFDLPIEFKKRFLW